MHDWKLRAEVRAMRGQGLTSTQIASQAGVGRTTVYRWLSKPDRAAAPIRCFVCDGVPCVASRDYVYLLGQYLGDGHLVTRARVPVLRIYACLDYPRILAQILDAVEDVRGVRPGTVAMSDTDRATKVQSYWMHWPCLFPQHGPGRKHERPIVLAQWQRDMVIADPWPLIRGLIHSDGCRSMNRVLVRGKWYAYPRYLFANESADILAIMGDALDRVGVQWRYNRRNSISVARRASVEVMDIHIGPKT